MTDAEHILCEVLPKILDGKNCKPHEVKVKPTTTDGANYTTSLFLVNASSPDRDELKLFAKVACLGDTLRASLNATWMFETEIYVYNHLVKIYDYIQSDRNVLDEYRYVFPKFYGFYPEVGKETVVMENLSEAGFKMYDRFASVDWDHARTAVENLARFHALSFAFEKYYPEEYMRFTSKMKFRLVRIGEDKRSESTTTMWKKMVDNCIDLICEEHRDQVRTFLLNNRLVDKFNKPLGKPVIAHGDYRMSNILFRRQGDSLQSIAVDYQTVHAGCPASDLIYFIFTGSDEEFRRQHYEKLLDHYYASLEQALERLAVDPGVYTREKFDSDMKEMLPYAVLLGVVVLPVVTVQADAAPSVQGDADVSGFVMAPNELYAQRFRGIVNDCVRWGAI